MNVDALLKEFAWISPKLGLETTRQLLANLGNPQAQVPIVHVAGTNGKGSVCAYLSAVLTAAGYRVGRYTSPHLVDWCERIVLNEQPIAPADLERTLEQVVVALSPKLQPSQFEMVTAAAWLYFAQQQVDIAIIEVGLGGRLDSTNVIDRPLVSVITSIGLDHTHILGETLGAIAGEKAGILKPQCPAVIGPVPPAAQAVLDRRLTELGCPTVYPEPATRRGDTEAEAEGIGYPLPLQGAIQLQNSAVAIAALQSLRQQGWQISDAAIAEGMGKTQWPGRMQWFPWQGHRILIDGAHNPDGAIALRQFVDVQIGDRQTGDRPTCWIIGMMARKDHAESLKALLRAGDSLYLVPVPDSKTADPEALAKLAQAICPGLAHCQTDADEFAALEAVGDPPGLTVLCGSLYLIGHFFAAARSAV